MSIAGLKLFRMLIIIAAFTLSQNSIADISSTDGNPIQKVLLPSAARTTTQTIKVSTPLGLRCGHIIINASSYTAGSLTPKIQGFDAGANEYYDILTGSAITSIGRTVLKICPGITPIANSSSSDMLPLNWQLVLTAGTADSITYSVSTVLLK